MKLNYYVQRLKRCPLIPDTTIGLRWREEIPEIGKETYMDMQTL